MDEKSWSPEIYCRNLVILLGKWFINNKRSECKQLNFSNFCNILKLKLQIYLTNFESGAPLEKIDSGIRDSFRIMVDKL